MSARVFVSQGTLDGWMVNEEVEVNGEVMTVKALGQKFQLVTALHFVNEVAEGGDEKQLIGKVKDLMQVIELGGEHCSDSVILGDNAYEVVEGFLGTPLVSSGEDPNAISGPNLAAATRAATGEAPPSQEIDLLAHFFLGSAR